MKTFNFYVKPDRSWIHLEFESDSIKEEDLRRFRSYEAVTSLYLPRRYYHLCDLLINSKGNP